MHDSAVADCAGLATGDIGRDGGRFFSGGDRDGGAVTPKTPQRAYLTGILIALSAIAMFFAAIVSAAVVRSGSPSGDWQPLRAGNALWMILSFDTLVLAASSFTLLHARKRAGAADASGFRRWWLVTSVLGVVFLAGQLFAWRTLAGAGLYLSSNPSSSFFYLLTAAHGAHLLAGIAGLLFVAIRPVRKMAQSTAIEVASIYWHAMDAVWVLLFLFLIFGVRA